MSRPGLSSPDEILVRVANVRVSKSSGSATGSSLQQSCSAFAVFYYNVAPLLVVYVAKQRSRSLHAFEN